MPPRTLQVFQGSGKVRHVIAEQLLIGLGRLFGTAGDGQQARLLQGLLTIGAVHFQQALGLTQGRSAWCLLAQLGDQAFGFRLVLLQECLADFNDFHRRTVRGDQLQASQRVTHQVFAVQRLTNADLPQ